MPVTAAALVPHPPLLVPGVGRGADEDLELLRSACRSAVATTLDQAEALLVVGPGESCGWAAPGTPGSFRPYGPPVEVVLPGRRPPRTPSSAVGVAVPAAGPHRTPSAAVGVAVPAAGPPRTPSAAGWLDRTALPFNQLAELPLSLAVAAWLLDEVARVRDLPEVAAFTIPASLEAGAAAAAGTTLAAAVGTGVSAGAGETSGEGKGGTRAGAMSGEGTGGTRVGLLVMADLSARRTAKSPGSFHPAAEDFDRAIGDAIRKAELDRLLDLDAALAAELRVGGTAALWLLAGALQGAGELHGQVRYQAAPFGVGYLVGVIEAR
jgi:hypothetical protein